MDAYSFSMFPSENFLDLTIYQYGWEQCAPLHSFGPFVRNHYLFHYIISGQGMLDSDGGEGAARRYDLNAGQGFLLTPGQINMYCADKREPWKYAWIEFDGLRAAEYLENAGLGTTQPIFVPSSAEAGARVESELLYIATHEKVSSLDLIGHLYLFFDALIRASANRREVKTSQLRDFYVQEAIHYMDQNYRRDLTVEEIADVCKLNRSYFSKIFKDFVGCAPQEFLIRLRLSKAANMMKLTNYSIGEIAANCGYPNQLHFSRAFKKRYGISPREWRAQNQLSPRR